MNEPDELRRRFRELADSVPQQPGDPVEQRVLAAFRVRHSRRRRLWLHIAQAAALAIVACGLYIAFSRFSARSHGGRIDRTAASSADVHLDDLTGFVPLPYAQSGVPLGESIIMRVELPVSGLSPLGIPAFSRQPGQRITADVLVGQDGIARAVRFVQ